MPNIDIQDVLVLLQQLTSPKNALVNSVSLYMDDVNDVYLKVHTQGDPGTDELFKLLVYSGYRQIPSGNQSIDLTAANFFKATPDQNATWTTTSSRQGWLVWIQIENTGGYTITFGDGFDVSPVSEAGTHSKLLYCDGTVWKEFQLGTLYAKTVPDGIQNIDISGCSLVYCKLGQDTTFSTTTGGRNGQIVMFILEQDSIGYHYIRFGNGFQPSMPERTSGPGRVFNLLFVCLNDCWYEITMYRTGIPYGVAYTWQFKMVDSVNFATPKTGRLVAVEISKEGSSFTTVTGTPPVTEIGYGWYAVTIPAVDMAHKYIILKATASDCAQTDAAIYTTVW